MIDEVRTQLTPNDRFLFYWSGHGDQIVSEEHKFGFLPLANSKRNEFSGMISMDDIARWNRYLPAQHALFILDSCLSGLTGTEEKLGVHDSRLEQLAQPAHHLFTAGTAGENVISGDRWGGSLFTDSLIRGAKGEAAKFDPVVTLWSLLDYVQQRVALERELVGWRGGLTPQVRVLSSGPGAFFFAPRGLTPLPSASPRALQEQAVRSEEMIQKEVIRVAQQKLVDEGALAINRGNIQSFRDRPAGGQPCAGCPEFVVVPPGAFIMGSDDGRSDERPPHKVTIARPFAVAKFPITRGEFAAFVSETGYDAEAGCAVFTGSNWTMRSDRSWRLPGFDQDQRHPAVCINWDDANAFVEWLARRSRRHYRLLSEAEWEYATRAGAIARYFFGNNADDLCLYGNGADLTAKQAFPNMEVVNCRDGYIFTAPVGSFKANAWGLHDVHGNVRERVQDCYNDSYSTAPSDGSPWLTGDCSLRVLRGGSWSSDPMELRSASRDKGAPRTLRYDNYGFRVARDF
jgi:formylglycine-generating enzyme required for sulfatase activity